MKVIISFLLLLSIIAPLSINCDNYIQISRQGYQFQISGGSAPVTMSASSLPPGLVFKGSNLIAQSEVQPGQYIVGVKAIDALNKTDEKIIIMNVPTLLAPLNSINKNYPLPSSQTKIINSAIEQSTSGTISIATYNPSISNYIPQLQAQTKSITQTIHQTPATPASTNIQYLNSYFNQIGASNINPSSSSSSSMSSSQLSASSSSSNNLNSILSDFSNSTTSLDTYKETSDNQNQQQYQIKSFVNLGVSSSNKKNANISSEQVDRVFAQQKLAASYVAGNYTEVQQATANKLLANQMIVNITAKYQNDQSQQQSIYSQLNSATAYKTKIQSAISNINTLVTTLTTSLANQTTIKNRLVSEINQITLLNNQKNQSANKISTNIQTMQVQLTQTSQTLAQNNKQCNSINSTLLHTNKTINILTLQQALFAQQLSQSNSALSALQAKVANLMQQLSLAQQSVQQTQQNITNLKATQNNISSNISSNNRTLNTLTKNLAICSTQSNSFASTIVQLQSNISSNQSTFSQVSTQNNQLQNQINNYNMQINSATNTINNIQEQLSNATKSLNTLQSALPNATNTLNILLQSKAQIDEEVQSDQQALNAAIARFKSESQNLNIATMNLQNARAISSQADEAVNKLLASKGNILPYAVAVNSKDGLLGQTIISPSVNISNWFNYLSANFGSPAALYSSLSISALYSFTCSMSLSPNVPSPDLSKLQTFTGKIVAIKSKYELVVSMDGTGSNQQLQIPSCATLYANTANYNFKVGDGIIVKGSTATPGTTIVQSLVCISH